MTHEEMLELCAVAQQAPKGRTLRPLVPITDPRFRYTDAANTDIRKRFDAVRRAMKREQQSADVLPIKARR